MDAALSGIVVLDMATDVAGSYTCMLLGDMGAEVTKVELAGSPEWRGNPPFHLWNRGKKSISLDLERPGARGVLEALVSNGDVLVEDLLPGDALKRGLDYDTLSKLNARLLYCAIPTFGERGPMMNDPGDDRVVSAFSGVMSDQAGLEHSPTFIQALVSGASTALLAAFAVSSALYVREVEGIGQKIEVPLLNGSLAGRSGDFILGSGLPLMEAAKDQQGESPAYRLYECQDGQWIFIACGNQTFWNRLCLTLNLEELITDPRCEGAPFFFDMETREELIQVIGGILKRRPCGEWLQVFDEADIPVVRAETRDEFIEDPQVAHNSMMADVHDPVLGATKQLGIPVKLSETPGHIKGPAPSKGENTEELLKGLGFSDSKIEELTSTGVVGRCGD